MGSTRLPGKVLKPIAGRPMFSYQIERLRLVKRAQLMIVATTRNKEDDSIVEFCGREQVPFTRGSEFDVLSRYYEAAVTFNATTVVRITSDCPLLDPELVDAAIEQFQSAGCDYLSNMIEPTWPYGMAVEVMSTAALAEAHHNAVDGQEREHVTPYIYWRPEKFRIRSMTRSQDLSGYRLTVDTREDLDLVSLIIEALHARQPQFNLEDVVALLHAHPEWLKINEHIQQKSVNQKA